MFGTCLSRINIDPGSLLWLVYIWHQILVHLLVGYKKDEFYWFFAHPRVLRPCLWQCFPFLGATKHLYNLPSPSVVWLVGRLVCNWTCICTYFGSSLLVPVWGGLVHVHRVKTFKKQGWLPLSLGYAFKQYLLILLRYVPLCTSLRAFDHRTLYLPGWTLQV